MIDHQLAYYETLLGNGWKIHDMIRIRDKTEKGWNIGAQTVQN